MISSIQLADGSRVEVEALRALFPVKKHSWDDEGADQIQFGGYHHCFDPFGFNTKEWITCGSYQGDYVIVLEKDGRWYFTVIGYGSCSGCDSFQGHFGYDINDNESTWREIASFIESYHGGLQKFGSIDELKDSLRLMLTGEDESNRWYFYDDEIREAIAKIIKKDYE